MIAAGTLLALESGEYSDFGVLGFFRVLKDFDGKAVMAEYLEAHPDQQDDYTGSVYTFAAWLHDKGYVEDVDYMRWHIGSYGCFDRATEPEKNEPSYRL